MRISFKCSTNKEYVAINTLVFTLPNGTTITVDRNKTEYTITDGNLSMDWMNCYLWAINDCNIFGAGLYVDEEGIADFIRLVKNSSVSFELEDDADSDYVVENIDITSIC